MKRLSLMAAMAVALLFSGLVPASAGDSWTAEVLNTDPPSVLEQSGNRTFAPAGALNPIGAARSSICHSGSHVVRHCPALDKT
jgi:hypothetical protein